ncbi:MAG: DUF5132 domain-containing protein [Thermodesulfovibrionales bacterium]|nr:DUF5132 domain-containing protein [Thermodesulfovibrionales bacterium]
MPIFENGLRGNILNGLAIGIGAAIIAPALIPVVSSIVKPIAKAVIKGGILCYERGKESIAEISEMVEDIAAEAKAEIEEMQKRQQEGAEAVVTEPVKPENG